MILKDDSFELGNYAESKFDEIASRLGWQVKPSTRSENMFLHFDRLISKDNIHKKVEIKGAKRIQRHSNFLDDCMWVELKNVRGADGWLFGEADWIAQLINNRFLILDRKLLKDICVNNIPDVYVHKSKDALLKKYSRPNRHDIVSLIPLDLIKSAILDSWVI